MIKLILTTILIAGSLSLSATEQCFLRALKGDKSEYVYDRDESLLKDAMRDYHLLPPAVVKKFGDCPAPTFDDGCELKFGQGKCETYGMVRVRKCEPGFDRIDTGLCAERCPPKTTPTSGGALCEKPPILSRSIYKDELFCVNDHSNCEAFDGSWSSGCPVFHKSLGPTMCAYECPAGFVDTPLHCAPRLMQTPEYFLPRFERPLEAGLTEMEG